jgi:hypothetical protein
MRRYALVPGGDDRHRRRMSPSLRAGGQCLPSDVSSFEIKAMHESNTLQVFSAGSRFLDYF